MKLCLNCQQPFEGIEWDCPTCAWTPRVIRGHLAFAPELAEESEGFEADFFSRLVQLEPGNFWFEARNRLIIAMLKQHFPSATKLLEIGCGTGFVLSGLQQVLPELILCGSEIFSEGLTYAQRRLLPGVALFQMDGRCIPYQDEFDVIGAFDVLEHVAEDEAVLNQMFRATRQGGGIILTVPQHQSLWSITDEFSHHQRRYSRIGLVDKAKRAGFQISQVTSFVSFLLPFVFLSRIGQNPLKYDPRREFDISPALNRLLDRIMRFELRLITRGISLPLGGSLLVVARRPL